ncbi:MAG: DUF2802 domain-containing protein [Phycisphaerae bacterium]|nr:DUF2802 domain-containing protein [Phycisphaerae bacterium]
MGVGVESGVITHLSFIPPLAETTFSGGQIALLVIILGVSASMLLSARRRRPRNANSPRAYVREQVAQLREEAEVKGDMEALLAQIHEVARQMSAQLDTKFCKLERAIRDADERIARLDRIARMVEGKPVCDITVENDAGNADERYTQVHKLSDAGLPPVEIAKQTNLTTGEIELILALRRKTGTLVS